MWVGETESDTPTCKRLFAESSHDESHLVWCTQPGLAALGHDHVTRKLGDLLQTLEWQSATNGGDVWWKRLWVGQIEGCRPSGMYFRHSLIFVPIALGYTGIQPGEAPSNCLHRATRHQLGVLRQAHAYRDPRPATIVPSSAFAGRTELAAAAVHGQGLLLQ